MTRLDNSAPRPIPLQYAAAKVGKFVSTRRLGRIVQALLAANILIGVVSAISYYWQVELLHAFEARSPLAAGQANANDIRVAVIAGFALLLMLATGIMFLIWIYRDLPRIFGASPEDHCALARAGRWDGALSR